MNLHLPHLPRRPHIDRELLVLLAYLGAAALCLLVMAATAIGLTVAMGGPLP